MKRVSLIVGILLVFATSWAQEPEDIAIVTGCFGTVYVQRLNDSKEKVKKDETILKAGDKLIIDEGAYVILDTDYGDRKIFGKKEVIITKKNLIKLIGNHTKKSSWLGIAFNTVNKSKEIENYYRPGSVRGIESENMFNARSLYRPPFKKYIKKFGVNIDYQDFLLEPKNGNILYPTSQLVWKRIPKVKTFYVFVLNMNDSVLKQYSLADTSVTIEDGILEPDNYYKWIIIADLGESGLVDSGKFNVLDSSQVVSITETLNRIRETYNKKDPLFGHFIAASFLNEKGLYSDALKEINVCTKQNPNNLQYWRVKAVIHHNMGLSAIAKKDIRKVYQLSPR